MKINTKEQFISKAEKIHDKKYDYSKVEFKDKNSKIKIICPSHGQFEQVTSNHLEGAGCVRCITHRGYRT